MPHILAEVADAIGTVTLDHEARRNALGEALVGEVLAALRSFREARARVVVLRASPGPRSSRPATTSTSCPRPAATRWAGTTRCAGSCARSRRSRGR
jgi:hypothetical protein